MPTAALAIMTNSGETFGPFDSVSKKRISPIVLLGPVVLRPFLSFTITKPFNITNIMILTANN